MPAKGDDEDDNVVPIDKSTKRPFKRDSKNSAFIKGERRREAFLNFLRQGNTVLEVCKLMEMSYHTYSSWRERYPDFRAYADEARGAKLSEDDSWTGDFTSFRKKFLGFDTFYHQQRVVHALEHSKPQSVTMVLMPPEHGKTTLIEDWITYKVCTQPNVRITIVSEGQPHARKIMRRVQARLSVIGSDLFNAFGPFYEPGQERKGKPWSSDFFTVRKADHDERDYTLECRGWRSAIAGTRTDYMIIDDVTSKKNYKQSAEIVETLRQDFFTRPSDDGHIVIVGTRVGPKDVYEQLLDAVNPRSEEPVVSSSIILPAINHKGEALCPQMWPIEALERKRTLVGEDVWWRNYQQKPQASGALAFSDAVIAKAQNRMVCRGEKLGPHTVMGVDPALGGGCALVTWSYDDNRARIIDYVREFDLARTEDILALIDNQATRHQPSDVVIEAMAYQKALANDDRLRDLGAKHGFRILPHLTGGGGYSKLDEALGVAQMATEMSAGNLEIPWAKADRAHFEILVAEFQAWRGDVATRNLRQDMVMAAWFGWLVFHQRQKALRAHTDLNAGWKLASMPYQGTGYRPLTGAKR